MQAVRDVTEDTIEIVPVVVVTQSFPARPSSVPDIRDFVRQHLGQTPLSGEDVRTLGGRVADVLLAAAGTGGVIQVALRILPEHAEVDVLQTGDGAEAGSTGPVGLAPDGGPQCAPNRPERTLPATGGPGPASAPGATGVSGPVGGAGAAGPAPGGPPAAAAVPGGGPAHRPDVSFPDWLADALRREHMTMEAAARQLKVSVKTVSRWVGGATEPRLSDLSRIREMFGDLPFP